MTRVSDLEKILSDTQDSLKSVERQVEESASTIGRMNRQLALLTRERDGLKLIVASYDKEEIKVVGGGNNNNNNNNGGNPPPSPFASQLNVRVRELEAQVGALSAANLQLEEEAKSMQTTITELRTRLDLTPGLENKVRSMERENEALLKEVAGLRDRLGRGDYDPTTTKVEPCVSSLFYSLAFVFTSPAFTCTSRLSLCMSS